MLGLKPNFVVLLPRVYYQDGGIRIACKDQLYLLSFFFFSSKRFFLFHLGGVSDTWRSST